MVSEASEAESVKSGWFPGVTVSVTKGFWVSPPPYALTVMGYVPTAVLAPTLIVMVELPAPGAPIVAGEKLTVVPAGTPTAVNVMGLLKPLETAVEITDVPCPPCATVKAPGEVETAKFGAVLPPVNCSELCCFYFTWSLD